MFETSVVAAVGNQKKRRAGLLTVSLVAHTAVIIGTIGVSIASVNFPQAAPDEYRTAPLIAAVQIPPPLGNPNGGAKPQAAPAEKPKTPPPVPNQITAPVTVPDEVNPAQSASANTGDSSGTSEGEGLVEGPVGVPWGDPNSPSTDLNVPVDTPAAPVTQIYDVASPEVKAPVIRSRVEPEYPPTMRRIGMSAKVVVRCIIDRDGNVRDVQVVEGHWPHFNASVVEAVQKWRFSPGTYRGQPVDVYMNLTVNFNVKR
jgi:protein TonB